MGTAELRDAHVVVRVEDLGDGIERAVHACFQPVGRPPRSAGPYVRPTLRIWAGQGIWERRAGRVRGPRTG